MSVTWNGTTITGPLLIYLDEILVDTTEIGDPNRLGALICRSEGSGRVSWHFPDGIMVTHNRSISATFKQIISMSSTVSRFTLSREGVVATNPGANGVWHCRLNAMGVRDSHGSTYDEQVNVGIFSRGGGKLVEINLSCHNLAKSSNFRTWQYYK